MFFIFTDNFIDLDIWRMPALSCMVECWLFSVNVSIWSLSTSTGLSDWRFAQWEISSMKLHKPVLTRSINHSTFSMYTTNLFLHFSCIFMFLEIIKHNIPKNVAYFLLSSILKAATQKFTNFDKFFLMHDDMTAVTIQYNKTVSNKVKDN